MSIFFENPKDITIFFYKLISYADFFKSVSIAIVEKNYSKIGNIKKQLLLQRDFKHPFGIIILIFI